MKKFVRLSVCLLLFFAAGCKEQKQGTVVGFLDAFEDETLKQAYKGFCDALRANGYANDSNNFHIEYRNAQGDISLLVQSCDYFTSQHVQAIASSPTISTITAVQHGRGIPVCMMVSPEPVLAGLCKDKKSYPKGLFGVYETQDYIDTSVTLVKQLLPNTKKMAVLFNHAEVQSVLAMERMKKQCSLLGIELISRGVNQSSESSQAVLAMLSESPDVFFALPDNTVFASFETIVRACDEKKVPVFTSEAGLVHRGAVAAYGADMYHWGYQSGKEMADFLKNPTKIPAPVLLDKRIKMLNRKKASAFGIFPDSSFTLL